MNSAFSITSYTLLPLINCSTIKNNIFSGLVWLMWEMPIKSKYIGQNEVLSWSKHRALSIEHWACSYFLCCTFICLHIVSLFVRSSAKWLNVNLNVNVEQLQGRATVVYFKFTTRGHRNKHLPVRCSNSWPGFTCWLISQFIVFVYVIKHLYSYICMNLQ